MPVDTIDNTKAQATVRHHILHDIRAYLEHVRNFTPNARLYLLGAFLMGVTFEMYQLLLPLMLREKGYLEGDIGTILSGRATGTAIMSIPAALLLSRLPIKPALIASSILYPLFCYLAVHQGSLTPMYFATIGMGAAFTFYRVSTGPFFMRNSTPQERTHLFSVSFGLLVLAGLVGSLCAGRLVTLLSDGGSNHLVGYVQTLTVAILAAASATIPFFFITSTPQQTAERKISLDISLLKVRGGFYAKILTTNGLVGSGAGLIIPFLPLYFRDVFHQSPEAISFYQACVAGSMFIGAVAAPLLTRHFGLVRSIVLTILLSLPFMVSLAFVQILPLAVCAFILRGTLMNMNVPLGTNFALEVCRKDEQGLVNALIMLAWTGSWMISAQLGGELIERYGYSLTLLIASGLYALSALLFFLFFHKTEQRRSDSPGWHIPKGENA